ncbi:MAG: PQQ-binding-like beta-propeller repeat protein [Solirubrobacterales bacterium]
MRRVPATALIGIAMALSALACNPPASVAAEPVTAGSEALRTGWYPNEAKLTPDLLEGGGFGKIFRTAVKGQVYAQPLVSGNTLLAATENNWIYGLDPHSGEVKWEREVETPWSDEGFCTAPAPNVGVTGTPVIDPETNVAYFVAKSYASGNSGPATWKMHAIDLTNGSEEPNFPVEIAGKAENIATEDKFEPSELLQRPALLLMGGVVYAAFGSLCDNSPYDGWVVGISTTGEKKAMWASSPHGDSIWQGGGGLVSDGEGQILLTTGNSENHEFGTGNPPPPGPGNQPPEELGESVVRLQVQSGGGLKATDFFSPSNNVFLDENDLDFGSGAPLGLPSAYFGTTSIPHLMVEVGKEGVIYLLNRDDLGGMDQGTEGLEGKDDVVQEIPETGGLWGSMAVWPGDGGYIYVPSTGEEEIEGKEGSFEVFGYGTEAGKPHLSLVAEKKNTLGYGSGSPIVTSNGTESGSGIVWQPTCVKPYACKESTLVAYAAVPKAGTPHKLWSEQIGVASKFARPEAHEGRIYVGALDGHVVGFGPTPSLNLTKTGAGGGTVTSNPSGIDCGATCSARFPEESTVTLTETPAAQSEFTGWSGCSHEPSATECEVTIAESNSVSAGFSPTHYKLTVSKTGAGSGTVTSSPTGINCGSTCSASFKEGETITLTETPTAHNQFSGWSGCSHEPSATECEVTMSEAKSVSAGFAPILHTLNVSKTGSGTVSSTPSGIACGATCSAQFDEPEAVVLTASPSPRNEFKAWSGCQHELSATKCEETMSADRSVGAEFQPVPDNELEVTVTGQGSVSAGSGPISDCTEAGGTCRGQYEMGSTVTLTETPAAHSQFSGWSGCDHEPSATVCEVTITEAESVSATFTPILHTLNVSKTGAGSGTVTSSPTGINCGSTCSASFKEAETITLTETPAAHNQFTGWSGCTNEPSATECDITMSEAKSVSAGFAPILHTLSVSKFGYGTGTVTSSPAGIECGTECSASFKEGEVITLTEVPAAHNQFVGWIGCSHEPSASECEVTISEDKTVSVAFTPTLRTLNVSKLGYGTGTITSSPAGIECGTDCFATFGEGEVITLTETPAAHSQFAGWSGCPHEPSATQCEVTISEDLTVSATFTPILHTITVAKAGSGQGTVSSAPAGIECGSICSANFDEAEMVTLIETPAANSQFSGWSGCVLTAGDTCEVESSDDRSVTANFTLEENFPPPPPSLPNSKITAARIRQSRRMVSFRFRGETNPLRLQCRLIRPGRRKSATRFSACASPKAYSHLKPGPYTFEVRAINSAGADPSPAIRRFRI